MLTELQVDTAGRDALIAHFDRLPVNTTMPGPFPKEFLEELGFQVFDEIEEIFIKVEPPEGWYLAATHNVLMNEIRDNLGTLRGSFFYKAWQYERHAYFTLF